MACEELVKLNKDYCMARQDISLSIDENILRTINTGSSSKVIIDPQPLKVELEISTDWPVIFVGSLGVIITFIIGAFTYKLQRNQIKSNLSSIRQIWIKDLRCASIIFAKNTNIILNQLASDVSFKYSREYTLLFSELMASFTEIKLMLDERHEKNKSLILLMRNFIKEIAKIENEIKTEDRDLLVTMHDNIDDLLRVVLEDAWSDIKKEFLHF